MITKVEVPTPWCSAMVVVPKKSKEVRICVDLKHLNESVLREVLPIPKVDETLYQLAGATVFAKIDTNSGFWQVPLSEESQYRQHSSRSLDVTASPNCRSEYHVPQSYFKSESRKYWTGLTE